MMGMNPEQQGTAEPAQVPQFAPNTVQK